MTVTCLYCDFCFYIEPTSSVNCPSCMSLMHFDERGLFLRYDENRILQTGPWLQLRWSDEDIWKDHRKLNGSYDSQAVVEAAKDDWQIAKAKWHLDYDCELRIK